MKIGDLVTLSKRGEKGQQNMAVYGKVGLLVAIAKDAYPFKIEWFGVNMGAGNREETKKYGTGAGYILPMKRYEIKQAK